MISTFIRGLSMIGHYSIRRRGGLAAATLGSVAFPFSPLRAVVQDSALPHAALAFRGVTVIDVTAGKRRSGQAVVIVGNRIQAIGPVRTTRVPAGAQVIDARGKYLIPGLWDMHVHGLNPESGRFWFWNGLTGVRDAKSALHTPIAEERQAVLSGRVDGPPRQLHAHGFLPDPETRDSAALVARVDSAKLLGHDMIKTSGGARKWFFVLAAEARRIGIRFGGHLLEQGLIQPGQGGNEEYGLTIDEALDSGVSIIDHISRTSAGLDRLCIRNAMPKYQTATLVTCRRIAQRMRQRDAWWVPTLTDPGTGVRFLPASSPESAKMDQLTPNERSKRIARTNEERSDYCEITDSTNQRYRGISFEGPGNRNWLRDAADFEPAADPRRPLNPAGFLSLAYRAGMPLLAGTDRDYFSIHTELALMVSEGLSPLAALQAATLNPARFLHATDSLGTVAPGKLADLVLLEADPLVDITNTTTIAAVVANGRYYDRAALDRLGHGCE